jgi:hypothetical protein
MVFEKGLMDIPYIYILVQEGGRDLTFSSK